LLIFPPQRERTPPQRRRTPPVIFSFSRQSERARWRTFAGCGGCAPEPPDGGAAGALDAPLSSLRSSITQGNIRAAVANVNTRRRSQRPKPRASHANMRKVAAQRHPLRSDAKAARRYQTAPLRS